MSNATQARAKEGKLWCSAGVTAALDMIFAFARYKCGQEREKPCTFIEEVSEFKASADRMQDPFAYIS